MNQENSITSIALYSCPIEYVKYLFLLRKKDHIEFQFGKKRNLDLSINIHKQIKNISE